MSMRQTHILRDFRLAVLPSDIPEQQRIARLVTPPGGRCLGTGLVHIFWSLAMQPGWQQILDKKTNAAGPANDKATNAMRGSRRLGIGVHLTRKVQGVKSYQTANQSTASQNV